MSDMRVVLDGWFGYHMLVIGADAGIPVAELTRVQHVTHIVPASMTSDPHSEAGTRSRCTLVSFDEELPIATESVDVVVMVNALDLSETPHQLLREVHRVLTPHGHLLAVGHNVRSPGGWLRWLLGRLPRGWRLPTSGPSASKLEDWLTLLDFSVGSPRYKLALPVAGQGRFSRWLASVDNWLAEHNIPLGSAYVIYADKMVRGHIQRALADSTRARLIGLPVAKPVVGGARGSASRSTRNHLRPID